MDVGDKGRTKPSEGGRVLVIGGQERALHCSAQVFSRDSELGRQICDNRRYVP